MMATSVHGVEGEAACIASDSITEKQIIIASAPPGDQRLRDL
jgi:hypothetical protein